MYVYIKASGCVEEVYDHIGRAMVDGGVAVEFKEGVASKPTVSKNVQRETAAMRPHTETGMLPGPRILAPFRRLFGKQ